MTADWPRIRAAFEHACDLPPADRHRWLDHADLAADERAEVARLLAAEAGDGKAAVAEFSDVLAAASAAEPAQLANCYRATFGRARALLDLGPLDEAEADLRRCQDTYAAAVAATAQKNQLLPADKDFERLAKLRATQR